MCTIHGAERIKYICKIDGCDKQYQSKKDGMCIKHFNQSIVVLTDYVK